MRVISCCCSWIAVMALPAAADLAGDCNQQQDPDRTIRACTELIARNPAVEVLFYNRGNGYAAKGQYTQAIADYAKAIELDPKRADAHHNIGLAHQKIGQTAQAIKNYTAALNLNPRYETALFNRGVARGQLGKFALAIEDFTTAIRLAPQARTYVNRAMLYERIGEVGSALADYWAAARLDPKLSAAKSALRRLLKRGP